MTLKTHYHGAPLKLLFIPPQTHLILNWILHRGVKLDSNLRNLLVNGANGGGRKGDTNTAIPHMVAREYRNTAS